MFTGALKKTALAALISGMMAGTAYAGADVLADFHGEMGGCDTCHVSKKGPTDDNLTHETPSALAATVI